MTDDIKGADYWKNKTVILCTRLKTAEDCVEKSCQKCHSPVYPDEDTIKLAGKYKQEIKYLCEVCAWSVIKEMKKRKIEITDKTAEGFGLPKDLLKELGMAILEANHEREKLGRMAG